jgi:hypothetical protein
MFLTSTRVPNGSVPRGRRDVARRGLAALHVGIRGADCGQQLEPA